MILKLPLFDILLYEYFSSDTRQKLPIAHDIAPDSITYNSFAFEPTCYLI